MCLCLSVCVAPDKKNTKQTQKIHNPNAAAMSASSPKHTHTHTHRQVGRISRINLLLLLLFVGGKGREKKEKRIRYLIDEWLRSDDVGSLFLFGRGAHVVGWARPHPSK